MFIEKKFYMKALGRMRKIMIYVPDDYQTSNKRYPVMYINDGQNAFFDEESYMGISWGFYDYVKETNLDIIMVAIPCNNRLNKREDDLYLHHHFPHYRLNQGKNTLCYLNHSAQSVYKTHLHKTNKQ